MSILAKDVSGWLKQNALYPVLFGWYPVLFFYQQNIREVVPYDLYMPMVAVTAGVAGLYLVFGRVWRSWFKAAVFLTVVEIIFFSHGHIHDVVGGSFKVVGLTIRTDWVLLAMWILILVTTVIGLRRWTFPKRVVSSLNMVSLALVALVVIQIGWYYITTSQVKAETTTQATDEAQPTPTKVSTKDATKPDVYYFIFDKHAASSTYSQMYGFDESGFIAALKDMGFYVAEDSHTNYPRTSFSVASSLNMNFIDQLLPGPIAATAPQSTTVDTLYDHNKVGKYLQQQGYTYYNFGSWFSDTQEIKEADVNVTPQPGDFLEYDSFNTKFLGTTLYPVLLHVINPSAPSLDWIDQHRQWAIYQYNKFPSVINKSGPKFVFSHILQPHNPFVFDQNCQPIAVDKSNQEAIGYYVNQTICADHRILEMMREVMATASTPPIIVLQADEGPEAMAHPMPNAYTFMDASIGSIKERASILNAYYFPDQNYDNLYQSITPVNSFRIIFNQYFGGNFAKLEDKTFVFKDDKHLFELRDVTKLLQSN